MTSRLIGVMEGFENEMQHGITSQHDCMEWAESKLKLASWLLQFLIDSV